MCIYIYYITSITGGDYKPTSHLISAGKTLHGQLANLSTFHQLKGDPCICAVHHQCFAEVGAEHVWKTLGGSHQTPWGLKHSLIKEYNLKRTWLLWYQSLEIEHGHFWHVWICGFVASLFICAWQPLTTLIYCFDRFRLPTYFQAYCTWLE